MNFDKSTKIEDTFTELSNSVHKKLIADSNELLNMGAKVRISQIRHFYGVPKTTLAKMIGTSYRQYLRYESGNSALPVYVISSLAYFYNLSADFLCGLSDKPSKLYNGEPKEVNGYLLKDFWGTAKNE